MVDTKVLIGIPTEEYGRRADFYDYFNLLQKPANTMVMFSHDRSPAHNRNIIVEQALIHECTHVLFVDDDMAFKSDALYQLLAHDKDIITGLYLRRDYPHQPLAFDFMDDDGKCLYMYLNDNDNGLKPIVAAGLGFCLIKTEVFKKMEKPYFRLGELESDQWCDDIGFFHRVKTTTDVKSFVDLDCKVGHIGTLIIWPSYEKNMWLTGYDTNGKGMISTPQIHPYKVYAKE
jgi:hypothetical protein